MRNMERETLVRRVVLLCCHFARNRAYYLAGWDGQMLRIRGDFWITVNGNFMDIAVLEWCKLFADNAGYHCWRRVVADPITFKAELYAEIQATDEQFAATISEMRVYRDKFIAHLDQLEIANIPHLDMAWRAARFYHAHLVASEPHLRDLPQDIVTYVNLVTR